MKSSPHATDKIYVRAGYSVHYRNAHALEWLGEVSPAYIVLFLLKGKLPWNKGESAGELRSGEALLVNPGESASVRGKQTTQMIVTLAPSFVFDCAVRARLTRTPARVRFRLPVIEHDGRLGRLAHDLAGELLEERLGQELVVAALIEQMIVYLLRRYANIRRSDEIELSRAGLVDRRIRRAVELMHAHLERDLSLGEMATAAHLSAFHFARLFKKLTGASPHAYLAALRIARAQTLLAETDLSVIDISVQVGYISPSHFAKVFRQATGLSPRAFRAALTGR